MCPKIIKTVFFSALFFVTFAASAEDIYDHLKQADALYQKKNYNRALFHYKNAINVNPSSIRALSGFARSSMKINSSVDALQAYKRILELESKNIEAIAGIAEIYANSDKFKEALALIDEGLKIEPYNPKLLITRASVLLKRGEYKKALRNLEDSKNKIVNNQEFNLLYARANALTGRYNKSEKILNHLITNFPDNAIYFVEMAKIKFQKAIDIYPSNQIDSLMKEAKSNLLTAIALDGENEETRWLLIKTYIWFQEYDKAQYNAKILEESKPNDASLKYILAFLSDKRNDISSATSAYGDVLHLNNQDEIGRFSSEAFAIKHLNEKHKFRTYLGKVRMLSYRNSKNDYSYGESTFHLMRSKDLIPNSSLVRKETLEFHYRAGHLDELINTLKKIRDDEPSNIKVHNRLENALRYRKQSLSYREGYSTIEGATDLRIRSVPEIFIFDPKPDNFLEGHPDTSVIIGHAMKNAFSVQNGLNVVNGKEEERIRSKILEVKKEYKATEGVFYSPEILNYLDIDRKQYRKIRYVGFGNYKQTGNSLSLKFQVYDRLEGKIIKKIKLSSQGGNFLTELAVRTAESVSRSIPIMGKVLKIKDHNVILNLGYRDGLAKDQILDITRKGKKVAEVKIKKMDEFISLAEPINVDWRKKISPKDTVEKGKPDDKQKKGGKKENSQSN